MVKRNFTSDYYLIREAYYERENGRDIQHQRIVDLPQYFTRLLGDNPEHYSMRSHRDTAIDPGRLQLMRQNDDGIFELQFIRLRERVQPEIAKPDGTLEVYQLEIGDIPAESASALFDPLTNVFVLQYSHFGASSTFVHTFLNTLFFNNTEGNFISLNPLSQGRVDLNEVFRRRIRKIIGHVEYEGEMLNIGRDIDHFAPFRPAQVDFSISANLHRKGTSLDQETAVQSIRELYGNPTTRKLDVVLEGIHQNSETVRLLVDTMQDKFSVHMPRKTDLVRHADIYPVLKEKYLERVRNSEDVRFEARRQALNEHGRN
ncbi:MAG: hypothetical protein E7337_15370 [Clostridiales bacterium]|nr:hypothetical protein [Clostridiales bacterium]